MERTHWFTKVNKDSNEHFTMSFARRTPYTFDDIILAEKIGLIDPFVIAEEELELTLSNVLRDVRVDMDVVHARMEDIKKGKIDRNRLNKVA